MEIDIDVARLRQALVDYYGTAMVGGLPFAVMDLAAVEDAPPRELIELAQQAGFDIRKYEAR